MGIPGPPLSLEDIEGGGIEIKWFAPLCVCNERLSWEGGKCGIGRKEEAHSCIEARAMKSARLRVSSFTVERGDMTGERYTYWLGE